MSDQNWNDNSIQFARLLSEIRANIEATPREWLDLAESMDLTPSEVESLFDRAECVFSQAKGMRACPDHEGRMYGCPNPAVVYTHCAACGTDLTLDNGEALSIASGLCPECGSEDIIEQEGD